MSRPPFRTREQWTALGQVIAALRSCGVKVDGRKTPHIDDLEKAERYLYGDVLTHLELPDRAMAVVRATQIKRGFGIDHPLNRAREYLRIGNKAFERGEFKQARSYFLSARVSQDMARAEHTWN